MKRAPIAPLLAFLLVFLPACAGPNQAVTVQDPQEPAAAKPVTEAAVAQQPDPRPAQSKGPSAGTDDDKFDWVKLTSGEWLKGEFLVMREESLEFDSDILDEVTIDWDDVAEIHSPRKMMILLEGRISEAGVLEVEGKKVTMQMPGEPVHVFDRGDLIAIVPGEETESSYWSGKLSVSYAERTGNVEQTDLQAYAQLKRETAATRWRSTYNGLYSETQDVETANNQRFNSDFDVYLSGRLFVRPVSFEYYEDRFQNIDYRLTPAAGLGYKAIDRGPVTWEFFGGAGWQRVRFVSAQPGGETEDDITTVLFSTHFNWDITSDVEFDLDYRLQMDASNGDSNHNGRGAISVDLWGDLDLDVALQWDRIGNRVEDENGIVPEANDFRLTVGLGWSF